MKYIDNKNIIIFFLIILLSSSLSSSNIASAETTNLEGFTTKLGPEKSTDYSIVEEEIICWDGSHAEGIGYTTSLSSQKTAYGDGSYSSIAELSPLDNKPVFSWETFLFRKNSPLGYPLDYSVEGGYEHNSCSVDKCMGECILEKAKTPSLSEVQVGLTDYVKDCAGAKAGEAFKNAFDTVKAGVCALQCGKAGAPNADARDVGECARCVISGTAGKLPGAACVVGLWNNLAGLLIPYSDCTSECMGDPSTWSQNWGHPCRDKMTPDRLACLSTPQGDFVVEETCKECQWNNEKWDDNQEENVLNIKKWCPEDTKCVMTSSGRPTCKPPDDDPPKGPGGDHPDDNHDVSSLYIPLSLANASNATNISHSTPEIAVLDRGFPLLITSILQEFNESSALVSVDYLRIIDPVEFPLLIISTGGLYGLDSSTSFKSWLSQYVNSGGVLIAFAQQHGYEFGALPRGELNGYGWAEDQSKLPQCKGLEPVYQRIAGKGVPVTPFP